MSNNFRDEIRYLGFTLNHFVKESRTHFILSSANLFAILIYLEICDHNRKLYCCLDHFD